MKEKKNLFMVSIMLVLSILLPSSIVFASENLIPSSSDNTKMSLIRNSALVSLDSGYMRVYYDGKKDIGVEYYDDNFNVIKKNKIALELEIYGGFFASKDAYYIVEGQKNEEENPDKEVIRVIKYDKNWKRIGAAKITGIGNDTDEDRFEDFGKQVRYPFDAGCVEMTEVNGKLYIVTGHEGFVDEQYNQGHQGFLLIEVDENNLTGFIAKADLGHSFAQYIDHSGNDLYVLEKSEGGYRAKITKYDTTNLDNKKVVTALEYGGERTSAWAIPVYATVNGITISQNNVLSVGTSIDQSKYDNYTYSMAYNLYLTVTPKNNFTNEGTKFINITNYADATEGSGKRFAGVQIVKVNDNKFMISWKESNETQDAIDHDVLSANVLHYVFVDENGNKIGEEHTAPATLSDCKPVLKGNKLAYYTSNGAMTDFYTIDVASGKLDKVMYRTVGESATWNLDNNGVLTISGTGEISNTSGFSSAPLRDTIQKVVIEEGITSIPENGFSGISSLKEAVLPNTMKTIGKRAFSGIRGLEALYVPSGVTSIGEDVLWTGYTWTSSGKKVYSATVYTPQGSYAEQWAKTNEVKYEYDESLKPSEATKPSEPAKPSEPTKPGETTKPSETVKPGEETKPSETVKPEDTNKPETDSKPSGTTPDNKPTENQPSGNVPEQVVSKVESENKETANKKESPNTATESAAFYGILSLVLLAGIVVVFRKVTR